MTVPQKQTCPRRHENEGPFLYEEMDRWIVTNGNTRCSYCGSLHPAYVLEMMRMGVELGPTDKNYKVYLSISGIHEGKFYFQHFSTDQMYEFIELYNTKPRPFTVGDPGHFYVLPYFIALERGVDDDG